MPLQTLIVLIVLVVLSGLLGFHVELQLPTAPPDLTSTYTYGFSDWDYYARREQNLLNGLLALLWAHPVPWGGEKSTLSTHIEPILIP